MNLKSLELFGFKSFPEKTTLKFDPGITVVVGPNGCGKSNVFDAIKWSLGEQSPKSLRGSKMEDIIFNGTDKIDPLNYAEVTLVFCNDDGYLPIEYKEVAITRRLYRSGESQYFINKNIVRLKDVNTLFLGTGIGESSYSFIEQGKVTTLLSYRPEEKRLIFDEASGIIKYKEKKRETMRRLKEADENILRLDDIIAEVKRQIRYLERQVEKARKYKETNQKLIEVEKQIASIKLKKLDDKVNSFLDTMNSFKEKEANQEKALVDNNGRLQELNNSLKEVRAQMEAVTSKLITTSSHIENYRNHISIDNQRIEELNLRIENLSSSIEEAQGRIVLQNSRIEEEKKSLESLDGTIASLSQEVVVIQKQKDGLYEKIEAAKKKITTDKDNILHFEEEKMKINNNIIEVDTQLKNLFARKKRLMFDKAKIDANRSQRKESLTGVDKQLEALEEKIVGLRKEKNAARGILAETIALIGKLEREVIEKDKALIELNSYLEFLKELKIKYDEFPLSRKVTIIFDEKPQKINKLIASLKDVDFDSLNKGDDGRYKVEVDAKIISLPEEELARRIENLTAELERIKTTIEGKKQEQLSLEDDLSKKEEVLSGVEIDLRDKRQEKDILVEELNRFDEEDEIVSQELCECEQDMSDNQMKKDDATSFIQEVATKLETAKASLDQNQRIVNEGSDEYNAIEIEITKKESEIKSLGEYKQSFFSKLSILEEEKNNLISTKQSFEQEKQNGLTSIGALKEEVVDLEKKIISEKEIIDTLSLEKVSYEEKISNLEKDSENLSLSVKDLEKVLEEIRSSIYSKKLEIQKLDFEKTQIFDYLKQVYEIELKAEDVKEPERSFQELEEDCEKFKRKMNSLGEVNLVAIEEFEELNQRFDFLTTQKEDLLTSKDALKKAINKINRTSKEVFLDVFAKVSEEFKKNFKFLFGGGRAQLVLLDEDNVLESGVEIEVQPPGKKLQNVSLLSGGEKALTAIALIFSIFQVRPSPICVLDEIDAPLDEANVDRFNQMLKRFSPTSQFIVITHNKKTMSRADVLYGVTMQEKGISKLVSVRFNENEDPSKPQQETQEPVAA